MGGLSSKQIPNEFFPAHVLVNQWERTQKKSGYWGLTNLGNTCFLNSVLQCICGTATLVNTCHADSPDSHTKLIERQGLDRDWICTVEAAINKLQTEPTSSQALKPTPFTNKISEIMKSHRKGEQEDAHEFFMNLLDFMHTLELKAMEQIYDLSKEWKKKNRAMENTTRTHQIFGGTIRSQVLCGACKHASRTHDHSTGLELELTPVGGLEESLAKFTAPETLAMANAYLCEKCKRRTQAVKRIALLTLPNVLVIQLKRFSYAGGKVTRHVHFPAVLDMEAYLAEPSRGGHTSCYDLHGVIVHSGTSPHSGHYYAFVKGGEGDWYQMDDAQVKRVQEKQVLSASAYMLFYSRRHTRAESLIPPPEPLACSAPSPSGPLRAAAALLPLPGEDARAAYSRSIGPEPPALCDAAFIGPAGPPSPYRSMSSELSRADTQLGSRTPSNVLKDAAITGHQSDVQAQHGSPTSHAMAAAPVHDTSSVARSPQVGAEDESNRGAHMAAQKRTREADHASLLPFVRYTVAQSLQEQIERPEAGQSMENFVEQTRQRLSKTLSENVGTSCRSHFKRTLDALASHKQVRRAYNYCASAGR